MIYLIIIGALLITIVIGLLEFTEYIFEGSHDSFWEYLKDKYKKD